MANFPRQKLSKAEKNDDWKIANVDFLADNTDFFGGDKREFLMLHRAAQGHLDPSQYGHVLNPYNSEDENLKRYPARMRNYDIIQPIVNLFMGEMAERPSTDEVICVNPDVPNNFKDSLNKQMLGLAAQDFVNQLNDAGVNTGVNSQELPEYQKFAEEYKQSWSDQRAIFGQEALDYIKYNCDLKDKYQDVFYDWLVTGHCYTFKEPRSNDVHIEYVPSYELWHGHSPTNFVEDANYAVRRFRRTPSAIIDMFRKELKSEDITWLENLQKGVVTSSDITVAPNIDNINGNVNPSMYDTTLGLVDVFHGVWKSFKEIGILEYIDELGQPQEMEVDASYVLNKDNGDIRLTKEWISEVWEGYRIDKTLHLKIQPIIAQRNELNNSSKCKLPYNGRIGYNKHTSTGSMVRSLLPYQALYNIYHFRAELTLARNKDKIMTMPIGLIPKDWSPDKFLWFAETTGVAWFDETKPNAAQVLNALKSIDLGLGNYVEQIRNLLGEIKNEAWDSVGMNRQRYGDTKASDGKGVSEQAIMRSSTISREMFRRFEKFMETDKQGLLDISKVAWVEGKKGMYITSDGRKKFFETNGIDHLESDYAIFAKDAGEEQRKLDAARSLTNMMAQKGGIGASLMFETLDASNFSQLKKYALRFEEIQQQLSEQAAEKEQQNSQLLQDKINAKEQAKNDTDIKVAEIQAGATVQSATIKAHTDIATTNMTNNLDNNENEEKPFSIIDELLKAKKDEDKISIVAAKNNADNKHKEQDLNLKETKINNDAKHKGAK